MRAVLLFSAVLHVAAIGALAAFALRAWLNVNRPNEPTTPEYVAAAGALAAIVTVIGTILSWMGRGFGPSLTTGLAAGLLAGLAFMLTLGTLSPGHVEPAHDESWRGEQGQGEHGYGEQGYSEWAGEPMGFYVRMSKLGLIGALVVTEVAAFCLLMASAGRASPWS